MDDRARIVAAIAQGDVVRRYKKTAFYSAEYLTRSGWILNNLPEKTSSGLRDIPACADLALLELQRVSILEKGSIARLWYHLQLLPFLVAFLAGEISRIDEPDFAEPLDPPHPGEAL